MGRLVVSGAAAGQGMGGRSYPARKSFQTAFADRDHDILFQLDAIAY